MTTSTLVEQLVQPRTWSIIHWSAASTSVPPPPKSWAGPAREIDHVAGVAGQVAGDLGLGGDRQGGSQQEHRQTYLPHRILLLK